MKILLNNKKIFILFPAIIGLFLISLTGVARADYKIEIGLPNLPSGTPISDPGAYVKYLFIFGLSLAGFLAVGAIALGGINYMLAGSITSVDKAKSLIIGALSGIALLLCSWLLLATIDPTLTNLSPKLLPPIKIAAPPELTAQEKAAAKSGFNYSQSVTPFYVCMSTDPYETDAMRTVYTGANAQANCGNECSKKKGTAVTYWCEKYPK